MSGNSKNWRDQGEMSVWLQAYSLKAQTGADSDICAQFADQTIAHCRERRPTGLSVVDGGGLKGPLK